MKLLILVLYLTCVILKLYDFNDRSAKEKGLVSVKGMGGQGQHQTENYTTWSSF